MARDQSDDHGASRRTAGEQAAERRAAREQVEALDLRNSILGKESIGNRQLSAEEANELRKGAKREGLDSAALLEFSHSLADVSAADDDAEMNDDEEKEHKAEVARDTAVSEDLDSDEPEKDPDDDDRKRMKKSRRRYLESEKKTSALGGDDTPHVPGGATPPPHSPGRPDTVDGLPVVTVVPRKRKNAIDLDGVLLAGRDAGILPAYLRHTADERLRSLTTPEFTRLFHALGIAGGPLGRAFVLKAMLVHRPSTAMVPFARLLEEAGPDDVAAAAPGEGAPDEPPDDAATAHIRLFWDPLAAVGVDEDWQRCIAEESTAEPWGVPKWIRGVPRPPLDLSIVAVEFALQGVLDPEESTTDGASDALARAFEMEGKAHPSLRRWLTNLLARAEDRDLLLAARDVMVRARAEVARPWTAPAGREPWR